MFASSLRIYVLPLVIIFGSFLNILIFTIMKSFNSTTSYYMSILALVDTGIFINKMFIKVSLNLYFYILSGSHFWFKFVARNSF
jgi:hypothetical protein